MKQILVSEELLRQVLDAIEQRAPFDANEAVEYDGRKTSAILALRNALEQPPQPRPVTPYACPKCHALWMHWPAEQTGFGEDTLNVKSSKWCDYCEKAGIAQLERLERVPAVLTAPMEQPAVGPVARVIWPSVSGLPSIEWLVDTSSVSAGMALFADPQAQQPKTIFELQAHIDAQVRNKPCNPHPAAPHGFDRTASHTENRYVCRCEYWEPDGYKPTENEGSEL